MFTWPTHEELQKIQGRNKWAAKALDDGLIMVPTIYFGSKSEPDLGDPNPMGGDRINKEYFTENTDLWLDKFPERPLIYDHAQGLPTDMNPVVGKLTAYKKYPTGVWMQGQLDEAHEYRDFILDLIKAGKLRASGDGIDHLCAYKNVGDSTREIITWPLAGVSLTVKPKEPRLLPVSVMKQAFKSIGSAFDVEDPNERRVVYSIPGTTLALTAEGDVDPLLVAKATKALTAGLDSAGGYTVQPEEKKTVEARKMENEDKALKDEKGDGQYGSFSEAGYADSGLQKDKKPRYPLKKDGKLDKKRVDAAGSYLEANKDRYTESQYKRILGKINRAKRELGEQGKGAEAARKRDEAKKSYLGDDVHGKTHGRAAMSLHDSLMDAIQDYLMDEDMSADDKDDAIGGALDEHYEGIRDHAKKCAEMGMEACKSFSDAIDEHRDEMRGLHGHERMDDDAEMAMKAARDKEEEDKKREEAEKAAEMEEAEKMVEKAKERAAKAALL